MIYLGIIFTFMKTSLSFLPEINQAQILRRVESLRSIRSEN
jgi:hypothetical protein